MTTVIREIIYKKKHKKEEEWEKNDWWKKNSCALFILKNWSEILKFKVIGSINPPENESAELIDSY